MTVNDISIAKLISRGLIEPLSAAEQGQLRDYLSSSLASQKFAELSAEIQMILAGKDLSQADPFLRGFVAEAKRSPPSGEVLRPPSGEGGYGGSTVNPPPSGEGGYKEGGYEEGGYGEESGPGLSQLSRARIARRLAEEMQAESDSSGTNQSKYERFGGRMVAEDETKYRDNIEQSDNGQGNSDQSDNNSRKNDSDADEKST